MTAQIDPSAGHRGGGRKARIAARKAQADTPGAGVPPTGGAYRPLTDQQVSRIHQTALEILERIGMGDPTPELTELALARGCRLSDQGRLCFPPGLIEEVIDATPKSFVLHGRTPGRDVEVDGDKVHYSTGGMAVQMVDLETGKYRPSTLRDLYDTARLVDVLDNIQVFNRTVVATELSDLFEFDINVAYACLAGTSKPIGTGFNRPEHIAPAIELFDAVLGQDGGFKKRPFTTCNTCAIVPPLKFGEDNTTVAIAGARAGFPVKMVVAAQAGATAPAALAGTLAQTTAETLAGIAMVHLAQPGAPVMYCNWPFVSDLRTGAFSGGGGEEAVLSAAAAQIARFYGLPNGSAAGMTDSKLPDNQAGYEKGITNALAGLAGANVIYESAGMMASLLGCSFESFVIDNEMLGVLRRAIRGIEVTEDSLSLETIEQAVFGPGHYLGSAQTLALMEKEYVYPDLGDRDTPDQWEQAGAASIRERARTRAREILANHHPNYIGPDLERHLRARFKIHLER